MSSAEGQKFAKVMRELEDMVKAVTMEEIEHTMNALAEEETKSEKSKPEGTVEVKV